MNFLERYKHIGGLILFAGVILIIVLRFSDIFSMATTLYRAVYPLFLGAIIAFVLNIIVIRYEKYYFPHSKNKWVNKSRKLVCIIGALFSVAFMVSFVLWLAIPQVVHSLGVAVKGLPELYANLSEWSTSLLATLPFKTQTVTDSLSMENIVTNLTKVGSEWGAYLVKSMGSVISFLFDFMMGLIFAIYILINKNHLKKQFSMLFRAYFSEKKVHKFEHVLGVASRTFSGYFVGQFFDAVILGTMVTLGCFVVGLPYASNVGCVIGLTALVPLLGAYLGGSIGVIMLFTIDPIYSVLFIVVLILMQQIEGNLIYPRVVGSSVGLPGMWVFAAVIVGGTLYGVPGILFSVPLTATAYKLLREDIHKRLV